MNKNKKDKLLERVIEENKEFQKLEANARKLYKQIYDMPYEVEEIKEMLIHELNPNLEKINPYNTLFGLVDYEYRMCGSCTLDREFLYNQFLDKLQKWKYIYIYTDENNEEYNNKILLKEPYLKWYLTPIAGTSPDDINIVYDISMTYEVYYGLYGYRMELEEEEYRKEYKQHMN